MSSYFTASAALAALKASASARSPLVAFANSGYGYLSIGGGGTPYVDCAAVVLAAVEGVPALHAVMVSYYAAQRVYGLPGFSSGGAAVERRCRQALAALAPAFKASIGAL